MHEGSAHTSLEPTILNGIMQTRGCSNFCYLKNKINCNNGNLKNKISGSGEMFKGGAAGLF